MGANAGAAIPDHQTRKWEIHQDDHASLGRLLSDVTSDISTLLRQEIQLARVETTEKLQSAVQSAIWMAVGGLVAYLGLIALVIAGIVGLAYVVPLWVSALIWAALLIIIGIALLQSGRNSLKQMSVVPEMAIESIKEDAELVKEKIG